MNAATLASAGSSAVAIACEGQSFVKFLIHQRRPQSLQPTTYNIQHTTYNNNNYERREKLMLPLPPQPPAAVERESLLSHTRLALDIDLAAKTLLGHAELTITPLVPALSEIKLNCRQCNVHQITINGLLASFSLFDPIEPHARSARRGFSGDVYDKFVEAASRQADSYELTISIPDGVECEMLEQEAPLDNSTATNPTGAAGLAGYRSWLVVIEYALEQPENAVRFVGCSAGPADQLLSENKLPCMHIYNPFCQARWWFPCIDKSHERATFEFELTIPRTVGDVKRGLCATGPHARADTSTAPDMDVDIESKYDSDPDDDLRMIAVCSGDLVEHFAHPTQPSKTVWIYSVDTAINASSILIAVGPFEIIPIPGWGRPQPAMARGIDAIAQEEDIQDDNTQRSSGRGLVFALPGYKRDVRASTHFLPQALEFFEQWTGASFPFASFKVVFLENSPTMTVTGATVVFSSVDLLVSETVIDQVFESRMHLVRSLAYQWFGHYIAPTRWHDTWCIVGLAGWMSALFMRKMFGANEFKYRVRRDMERVCELDVNQLPLCPDPDIISSFSDKIDPASMLVGVLLTQNFHPNDDAFTARAELVMLKSPLVLNMLEKRMSKGLLQKVANKLMVSAMSGELPTGILTAHFLKLVRKISGRLEVKEFADQWIYRSGCPVFTTRYNFNRKKMVIELKIKQECTNEGIMGATTTFAGPFTVRVREAGGTFDTEVRIEEQIKQYDIIYHTKYKRIRRRPTKRGKKAADNEEDAEEDEEGLEFEEEERDMDVDMEPASQGTTGDTQITEPERITFEWIQLDPEAVWICTKTFEQEDFMWSTLLRREREVFAQCEALDALSRIQKSWSLNTITTFARDTTHFYRLRMHAIHALSNFDSDELSGVAMSTLIKICEDHFCIVQNGTHIPNRNDFTATTDYYIRQAIVESLARFVDARGSTPTAIRRILVDLLRLNENSGNEFSDGEWVSILIKHCSNIFIARQKAAVRTPGRSTKRSTFLASVHVEEFEVSLKGSGETTTIAGLSLDLLSDEERRMFSELHSYVMRHLLRDKIFPSHLNAVTASCLEALLKWQLAGLIPLNLTTFLGYSCAKNSRQVRYAAIDSLIVLSAMSNRDLNKYLVHLALTDTDETIRYRVLLSIVNYFSISLYGHNPSLMLEQALTRLSAETEFIAESIASELHSNINGRMWLLILRLFEMTIALNPGLASKKPKLTIRMPNVGATTT